MQTAKKGLKVTVKTTFISLSKLVVINKCEKLNKYQGHGQQGRVQLQPSCHRVYHCSLNIHCKCNGLQWVGYNEGNSCTKKTTVINILCLYILCLTGRPVKVTVTLYPTGDLLELLLHCIL